MIGNRNQTTMLHPECPSNALDVELLQIGFSATGRTRTDLPMMTIWCCPDADCPCQEDR